MKTRRSERTVLKMVNHMRLRACRSLARAAIRRLRERCRRKILRLRRLRRRAVMVDGWRPGSVMRLRCAGEEIDESSGITGTGVCGFGEAASFTSPRYSGQGVCGFPALTITSPRSICALPESLSSADIGSSLRFYAGLKETYHRTAGNTIGYQSTISHSALYCRRLENQIIPLEFRL